MKRVTRDIGPDSARDLLERVPRACLSFACNQEPEVLPVAVRWQDGRYLVGVPEHASCRPGPGREVVLLVDEGAYFFDLRAIYIRGHLTSAEVPPNALADHLWFEVVPLKEVAWDYGTLHEVKDAH
jgi:hypothetical protein